MEKPNEEEEEKKVDQPTVAREKTKEEIKDSVQVIHDNFDPRFFDYIMYSI